MLTGYRTYMSYILESTSGNSTGIDFGSSIHCNYIKHVDMDSTGGVDVNIKFNSTDDFKFLNSGGTDSYGYLINKISIITQLIDLSEFEKESDIIVKSDEWRKFDVTNQISDKFPSFTNGDLIQPEHLVDIVFKVPLSQYDSAPIYNLDSLSYPSSDNVGTGVDKPLTFGDEEYFIGNVSTEIAAIAYTTNLEINLLGSEYNSSNNLTWDGESDVFISEVGLYDSDENLVAIGKLNKPIRKNSSITRTISFQIDF